MGKSTRLTHTHSWRQCEHARNTLIYIYLNTTKPASSIKLLVFYEHDYPRYYSESLSKQHVKYMLYQ